MNPPKPIIKDKKNQKMFHVMTDPGITSTQLSICGDSSKDSTEFYKDKNKELKRLIHDINMANEHDDRADVRDGIAVTKGKVSKINEDYRMLLRLVPKE